MASLNVRAMLVSLLMLTVLLGLWEALNQPPEASEAMSEFELLMGGADDEARVPPPSQVASHAWDELSNPFYDAGPNDKGIGIQLAYSLFRVLTGYFADAEGYLPPEKQMETYANMLRDPASKWPPSMLHDLRQGGATEADHVIGDMIRRASRHEIETPYLKTAMTHMQVYEGQRG